MPLKGIPFIISPDLLHVLSSAGHGDEIVLADAHFPTSSICSSGKPKEIRADGHRIPSLLLAITQLFPIDTYDSDPITVMNIEPCDGRTFPDGAPIWKEYEKIVTSAEPFLQGKEFLRISRSNFYDKAKQAFAVVATGETAQYGNIILRKGIVSTNQ